MAGKEQQRRHPRVKPPKAMFVAWHTGTRRDVSRLDTLALGGLFLCAPQPPPMGSIVTMLWDLPSGEWRARAVVRRINPKVGMGVEFVHMRPEDRGRLVQLLKPMLGDGHAASSLSISI